MAHAFVLGGAVSESERDIRVGGVDSVPAGVFGGVDYVALGHYHVYREIAPNAFYSGSIEYTSPNVWGELVEERDTVAELGLI